MRGAADFLNAHGWLHPPLIQRARMQDIEDSRITNTGACGKIELGGRRRQRQDRHHGWARNPRTRSPADAVVLSWEQPGGDAVPFAIADMRLKHPGEPGGSSLRSLTGKWSSPPACCPRENWTSAPGLSTPAEAKLFGSSGLSSSISCLGLRPGPEGHNARGVFSIACGRGV